MTPQSIDVEFNRIMGCTAEELLSWLPIALPGAAIQVTEDGRGAVATFADGTLSLTWHPLPARRIALLEIPCLHVSFLYSDLTASRRREVQRRFDLATQRGGG